jgi:hypothetical protein
MIKGSLIFILSFLLFATTPTYAAPTKPQYVEIDTPKPIVTKTLKDDEKEAFWPKSLKEWGEVLSPFAAMCTLIFAVVSYGCDQRQKRLNFIRDEARRRFDFKKNQKEKRFDFVNNKIKEFESDSTTINTLLMLTWGSIEFTLKSPSGDKIVKSNIDILEEAFSDSSKFKDNKEYNEHHIAVRYCFSEFLADLDRFNAYIDLKLISKEDLITLFPRLKDWLLILSNIYSNQEKASNYKTRYFYNKLWNNFIDKYNYKTRDLMEKYLSLRDPDLGKQHFTKKDPHSSIFIKNDEYDSCN